MTTASIHLEAHTGYQVFIENNNNWSPIGSSTDRNEANFLSFYFRRLTNKATRVMNASGEVLTETK